jgi:hypothetical protein
LFHLFCVSSPARFVVAGVIYRAPTFVFAFKGRGKPCPYAVFAFLPPPRASRFLYLSETTFKSF